MKQARQLASRCMHEVDLHDDTCMVTLTYDDEHLPQYGHLCPRDLTLWLKRLRKTFPNKKIRYFGAGEYGSQYQRPHYHVLIFGLDFQDELNYNPNDQRPLLTDLKDTWNYGHLKVTKFSYESAAYVARYCLKKQNETQRDDRLIVDRTTGVLLAPEFTRMSRMPGIGAKWLSSNHEDTYKDDIVIAGGAKRRPPRYYDKRYVKIKGEGALDITKAKRIHAALKRSKDSTPERLAVREKIMKSAIAEKRRGYEND